MNRITIYWGNKSETFKTLGDESKKEGKRFVIALKSMVSAAFMNKVTTGLIKNRKDNKDFNARIVNENK